MFTQPILYIGTMSGHHKISISGVVFYVEDDCRKLLMDHLKLLHQNNTGTKYVSSYESPEEAVAEILLQQLKDGKQVVTAAEVAQVISETKY